MDTIENAKDVQPTDKERSTIAIGAATKERLKRYVESLNYKTYMGVVLTDAANWFLDDVGFPR